MPPSERRWTAAVAAARANVTYVRVSPRKSPRNHQNNHPATWVPVHNRQSDGSSSSDTSEDDSDEISLKQETDDSDSDERDEQPLAETFGMGSGEAATTTGEFFFFSRLSRSAFSRAALSDGKTEFPRLSELFLT